MRKVSRGRGLACAKSPGNLWKRGWNFSSAILVVLLSCFLPINSLSQQPSLSELEKTIQSELQETKTPGAAVAIFSRGQVVFARGFGVASVETGAPVTNETLFQIGSLTKVFTAAAALSLAQDGKVQLDAPVGDYVRNLNPKLSKLTLRQLLSHTAGLKDEPADFGSHDEADLLRYVRSWPDDFVYFPPGEVFSYSNLGYTLAGAATQEAAGKPYADLMQERLFAPLGMKSTAIRPTVAMTQPIAAGHRMQDGQGPSVVRPVADDTRHWPAGYIWTNINDFSKFVIALLNEGRVDGKQVINAAVVKQLFESQVGMPTEGSPEAKYSYGLMSRKYRGLQMVEHGGSMPGFYAELWMVPDQNWAVIVLANRDGGRLTKSMDKALELMLPVRPPEEPSPRQQIAMEPQEMARYVGSYSNRWKLEISLTNGRLVLHRFGVELPITRIGPNRFSVLAPGSAKPDEFLIIPGSDGTPKYMQMFIWAYTREVEGQAPAPFSLEQARPLFQYDSKQPLDVVSKVIQEKDGVTLQDISFVSPKGGRVTAYLVTPSGKGPFAGIVFGHWGYGTRTEFLPEAMLYAKAGAVSILVDYPWVRPAPWRRETDDLSQPELDVDVYAQAVIDLRRAIDLLLSRSDVDPKRIAYVGHSYGAQWGAILAAVEKRIKTAVLAGGTPTLAAIWLESDDTGMVNFRNRVPKETLKRYVRLTAVVDGIHYVPHAAPTPVLFQFARFERYFNAAAMRRYAEAASDPKKVLWYDTGHELNDPQALADRRAWLQQHIGIRSADSTTTQANTKARHP